MITDCHSHLFFYKDVEEKIKQNKEKGVIYVIENGLNPETNRKVLEESKKFDIILPALGFHPTDSIKYDMEEIEKEIAFIKSLKKEIIAIGEIGLDFYWIKDKKEMEKEKKVFELFLNLAEEIKKPVIVHSRKSEKEVLDTLESFNVKVILHSFHGNVELVKRAIDLGYYFSIPSIIYKDKYCQKIIEEIPLDFLLTESDSPFLDPIDFRKNNSWKIIYGINKISEILKEEKEELLLKIYYNFEKLFLK